MPTNLLVQLAGVVVLGGAAQWLAWRLRLPSILLLLLLGFVAGPVVGFIDPDALLGDLLFPFVSIAVALILYEGGLTLKFAELPKVGGVVRNLVTVGAFITLAVSTIAARLCFGLDLGIAVLLGAVLVVTGPTVILPMLRHIRPTGNTGSILKWEAIVIDPIGALLAVLVFEFILIEQVDEAAGVVAMGLLKTIFVGGGLGLFAAFVLVHMIHKYWVPDFLQNAVSLMFVVAVHTTTNAVQHEAGLFAVTVMGMALTNQKRVDVRHIVEFKENLRILLISFLFILLAARLDPGELTGHIVPGLIFVIVLVFIARPLAVLASTVRSRLSRAEKMFLMSVAPRGIVAAAVSSVFALRLEQLGHEGAESLVRVTFIAIIGTVAIYGLASPILAHKLGVADAKPQGFLFVGAPTWARAAAKVLNDKGFKTLLVDTNRENIAAARMAGLRAYNGSVLAEYALDEIDLGGIGRLLAITPNDWVNSLAVQRFAPIFDRANCYQLPPQDESPSRRSAHRHLHGRWLFARELNHAEMRTRFAIGETIKATPLSEEFDFDDFQGRYGSSAIVLFVLRDKKTVDVVAAENPPQPTAGQTVISLVKEPAESSAKDIKH